MIAEWDGVKGCSHPGTFGMPVTCWATEAVMLKAQIVSWGGHRASTMSMWQVMMRANHNSGIQGTMVRGWLRKMVICHGRKRGTLIHISHEAVSFTGKSQEVSGTKVSQGMSDRISEKSLENKQDEIGRPGTAEACHP